MPFCSGISALTPFDKQSRNGLPNGDDSLDLQTRGLPFGSGVSQNRNGLFSGSEIGTLDPQTQKLSFGNGFPSVLQSRNGLSGGNGAGVSKLQAQALSFGGGVPGPSLLSGQSQNGSLNTGRSNMLGPSTPALGGLPGSGLFGSSMPQVSSSTLQLMSQVNMMLANVMQGLMALIQMIIELIKNKPPSSSGPSVSGPDGQPQPPPPGPGGMGGNAVRWALEQDGKTGGQMKDSLAAYHPGQWCADFVSTALEQAGGSPFGVKSRVADIQAWGKENGKYIEKGQGTPKEGDVVVFMSNGASHVGLVKEVVGNELRTVEGNSGDVVAQRSYSLDEATISGYVQT